MRKKDEEVKKRKAQDLALEKRKRDAMLWRSFFKLYRRRKRGVRRKERKR
jgi:hypothetical protein